MDPTQTYLEMVEAMRDRNHDLARQRAEDLAEWLARGGFYPSRGRREEVDRTLVAVLRRTGSRVQHHTRS